MLETIDCAMPDTVSDQVQVVLYCTIRISEILPSRIDRRSR